MDWRKELVERYPMLRHGGYPSVGNGWRKILEKLCEEIDREAQTSGLEVKVGQVKEKFGTLRFYVYGGNKRTHELVQSAEEASGKTCEACGAPGKLGQPEGSGWWKTCCVRHRLQWPRDYDS